MAELTLQSNWIPLTQEMLGELAGTSRATVNRVLNEEQRRGTVELRRGRTLIRDLDTLTRRAL
jgi:CRP/FNR family cyclic AMP-dependent transcriptional regulator